MNFENENNYVFLQGIVETEPVLDHTVKLGQTKTNNLMKEDFYTFNMSVNRLSNEKDVIPVTISEKFLPEIKVGAQIAMRGQFRSCNKLEDDKRRLILSMFCKEICELSEDVNPNYIELKGFVCKPPIYRTTPLNREICDILIAVNRNYNKSDYIPCIAWGKNAKFSSSLKVGDFLRLEGRIQSRAYTKHIGEQDVERNAYEVSISDLSIIQKEIKGNAI